MRLECVRMRRLRMPLVAPFRTSFAAIAEREVLLLEALTSSGAGWGECVALAEPLYSAEYLDGAEHVIRHHLLPRLFAQPALTAARLAEVLRPVVGHPMAKAAVEMAVLDAELRARGESFAEHLGAVRDAVDCGVSVGIHESVAELLSAVEGYLDQGYRRVKLKIEPGRDVGPVRAVRERFPHVPLQVDANAAYTLADARHLARLDAFDLLLIEQPLPDDQVLAHAALARTVRTPICLDESITSARAAADAIALGACAIVNVKPGRVGGYLEARRVHDVCRAAGVPVWCGGMLETGLGRAGNVALAALPGFTLPGDTSASDRYYARDLTEPFVMDEGRLAVPAGPGLGVDVVPERLRELTARCDEVVATR
ncbi:MAG TPA: o-succinylbenzoate synthase [Candidatus Dormibacteraeota bacterium]|nr:o-succinylbenzoate synthase [Candidatus Dormibacteraeota bacterium]